MANETDVRQRVNAFLRSQGFFVQAMETGAIADGVPDLWYAEPPTNTRCAGPAGCNGWLELKKVRVIPKRADTTLFKSQNHDLGMYQANWISSCRAAGISANILVAYERRYFFVPGQYADEFNEFTWARLQEFEIKKEQIPQMLRRH